MFRIIPSDCPNMHGNDQNCDLWAPAGECDGNPDFMLEQCKRSCRVCSADTSVDGQFIRPARTLKMIHRFQKPLK